MAGEDFMSRVRDEAHAVIARNAMALSGQAPLAERARRWWDLPAKVALGEQISDEEKARSKAEAAAHGDNNPHNDRYDAMRHARWSMRMADRIGPIFSAAAGVEHELAGLLHGQPLNEMGMDLHNNFEGIGAAHRRQPIDPSRLRTLE